MRLVIQRLIPGVLAAAAAFGQTPGARPEFEVASIRPTAPGAEDQINLGVHIDGAMVMIRDFSLNDYIGFAYNVRDYQITGPSWLPEAKFDISAKFPQNSETRNQLREMVQSLLEDRFKLAARVQKKEMPVYALVVSKNGPPLKESPDTAADASGENKDNVNVVVTGGGRGGATVDLGKGSYISNGNGHVEAHKVTIASLVEGLWRMVDRPIIDMTGLTGTYDFSLAYGVDDLRTMLRRLHMDRPIPDGALPPASIFDSLKAAGLTLEARKAPIDIIVIDHMEKTPSAN